MNEHNLMDRRWSELSDELHDILMVASRLREVSEMNNQELRLLCGEMSNQEIRTVRAVLNYIIGKNIGKNDRA